MEDSYRLREEYWNLMEVYEMHKEDHLKGGGMVGAIVEGRK